jgi:uncharacterized protein YndB with AHSA1/START domain
MTSATSPLGTITERDGRHILEYERRLAHPIERVWRALTEPDEVAQWLAIATFDELAVGGAVTLKWQNAGGEELQATITELEPGRLIEYDCGLPWGTVRWELSEDGDGSILRLTAATRRDATMVGPGWQVHLEHLERALAGEATDWPNWDRDHEPRWRELRGRYARAGMLGKGYYEDVSGERTLRFVRYLAHPPERVWRAVTDPAELKEWFPAGVEADMQVGGKISFSFADAGEVLELDEPRVFAFTWGADELRFELDPLDDGCLLAFTQTLGDREMAAKAAAGWDICLDALAQLLAGTPVGAPPPEPTPDWLPRYALYVEDGLPAGSPVPGA